MRMRLHQKTSLFVERLAERRREIFQSTERFVRIIDSHLAGFDRLAERFFLIFASMEPIISSMVSNGP